MLKAPRESRLQRSASSATTGAPLRSLVQITPVTRLSTDRISCWHNDDSTISYLFRFEIQTTVAASLRWLTQQVIQQAEVVGPGQIVPDGLVSSDVTVTPCTGPTTGPIRDLTRQQPHAIGREEWTSPHQSPSQPAAGPGPKPASSWQHPASGPDYDHASESPLRLHDARVRPARRSGCSTRRTYVHAQLTCSGAKS